MRLKPKINARNLMTYQYSRKGNHIKSCLIINRLPCNSKDYLYKQNSNHNIKKATKIIDKRRIK